MALNKKWLSYRYKKKIIRYQPKGSAMGMHESPVIIGRLENAAKFSFHMIFMPSHNIYAIAKGAE